MISEIEFNDKTSKLNSRIIQTEPAITTAKKAVQDFMSDQALIKILNKFMFFLFFIFIIFHNLFCLLIFPYFIRKPLSITDD